jgi:hypothetical protein
MKIQVRIYEFIGKKYLLIALICFSIPLIYYSTNYSSGRDFGLIHYASTSFAVNYFEYGFVKRGLIGTLLAWIPGQNYWLITLICSIIGFFILLFIVDKLIGMIQCEKTANFFKITFAISPFAAFQFGFELGRLDIFNILLLIAALHCILKHRWTLVIIISLCGLLLHEAFAAFALPVIVGFFLMQPARYFWARNLGKYVCISILVVACFILTLLIIKYGNSDLVVKSAPGGGHEVWARPLVQHGLSKLGWLNLFVTFVVSVGIYAFLINIYRMNSTKPDALFLAAFCPLALFFLGWDYARWTALIGITVMTIFFIKVLANSWKFEYETLPYAGAIFLIPFGPIGCMNVFPFFRGFLIDTKKFLTIYII